MLANFSYKKTFIFRPTGARKSQKNLVIPMVMQKDWRIVRLLQMKNEGKLNEEELVKLDLLTESASSSTQQAFCFLLIHFLSCYDDLNYDVYHSPF